MKPNSIRKVHQKELDMKEVLKRQQDEFVPISVRAELLETLEKAEVCFHSPYTLDRV